MEFFKKIYYELSLKGSEPGREISIIAYITICQTFNVITVSNIIYSIFWSNEVYHLPSYFLILYIVLFIFNYYYFEIKKNGEKLIKERKFSYDSDMSTYYIIASLLIMFLSFGIYLPVK